MQEMRLDPWCRCQRSGYLADRLGQAEDAAKGEREDVLGSERHGVGEEVLRVDGGAARLRPQVALESVLPGGA